MLVLFVRLSVALLSGLSIIALTLAPASAAQGHQGLQGGWAIDDSGRVNFLHSVTSELPYMAQAGAGAIRINFRLGACFSTWTAPGCATADGPNALAVYDTVVNTAMGAPYNLQVIGLLSNESWNGTPDQWTANNAENTPRSGDNTYIQNFATNAAGVLAKHFAGRITTWEVWNEPNAWTANPSPTVFTGGTFIYPSNFAWMLRRSYAAIKTAEPGTSSTVISGGLFGHDAGGTAMPVLAPNGARTTVVKHGDVAALARAPGGGSTTTCTSVVPSGADYLCNTYVMGRSHAGWKAGAYPLDRVGQHLYIDQGGKTTSSKVTTYLQDVRSAYVAFEGAATTKKTEVTELGWFADPSSPTFTTDAKNQAANVTTAYNTFHTTPYVARADYFVAQDVPEGNVFYGLVEGDGTTYKPAFQSYVSSAAY